jgi:osmoprotectant transport system ATP-binding protein
MIAPMIAFEGAAKDYAARRVVGPLTFAVAKGQFVALLGGSGSGKTTTLKMINGLVTPDAGSVSVDGARIGEGPLHVLRRKIGYVFQDVGLLPHMTVAENIALGPRLAGWDKARTAARVGELLELVSLPPDAGQRMPASFSGGQRQRVGVARALAAGPGVMLMDEPFGALDPITRDGLGRDYRALHDRLGLTTVMVTHDVTEALLLADRVVVLGDGRILADGSPQALMGPQSDPKVQALMATPVEQARRLDALAAGAADG